MKKKVKLGRGLDILLSSSYNNTAKDVTIESNEGDQLQEMPVNLLKRGEFQPREEIDPNTLEELSQSIKAQGIIQPIVAREIATNQYEIIAGERRWRAAQLVGLTTVPVVVRDISDKEAVAIGLIENIQREGLTPLEEANSLQRLIEEFSMTHKDVASAVGRSRSAVTNLIRLLQLNDKVKGLLNNGDIQMGHARALLTLDIEKQYDIANQIIEKDLSVRLAEQLVANVHKNKDLSKEIPKTTNVELDNLNKEISKKLGVETKIQQSKSGKGKLVINYNSSEELNKIIAKF